MACQTYFKLLLAGYATGSEPETVCRFPGDRGTKRNLWSDEKGWIAIDEWRTSPLGDGGNGTTSIYCQNDLVWEMQYGGYYPDDVIPFLRQALSYNYDRSIWQGGRGPIEFVDGLLRYSNQITHNDFAQFQGVESVERMIGDSRRDVVGVHWYRGGLLF